MIEHPEMRSYVLDVLNALADPDYQRRVWVERQYPHSGFYDDLDTNIHLLYDDSDIAENPRRNIGFALRNEEEARAIERLNEVLSPLYDSLPADVDHAALLAMPEWRAVVNAAQEALRVFSAPDSAD
ncbi:MAG: SCO4402 family protein [Actinomadura sp.]